MDSNSLVNEIRRIAITRILGSTVLSLLAGEANSKEIGFEPAIGLEFELIDPEQKEAFLWALRHTKNGNELVSLIESASNRLSSLLETGGHLRCSPATYSKILQEELLDICEIALKSGEVGGDGTGTT